MPKQLFGPNGVCQNKETTEFRLFLPEITPKQIWVNGTFNDWGANTSKTIEMSLTDEDCLWCGKIKNLPAGLYQYRYCLQLPDNRWIWATDPCAKQATANQKISNSAFQIGKPEHQPLSKATHSFKRTKINQLRIYEMMISDWTQNQPVNFKSEKDAFTTIAANLDYLINLGFNAIEFMPWLDCSENFSWGYNPIHFFAPNDHYGSPQSLKQMIAKCHSKQIAVIMDIPLNHTDKNFGYFTLYGSNPELSPFIGNYAETFADLPDIDYANDLAYQFVWEVCKWWLDEYQVDGFRFDFTAGYYRPEHFEGLQKLLFDIRNYVKTKNSDNPDLEELPYLCIEHLGQNWMLEVLNQTAANACWYDTFRHTIAQMAQFKTTAKDIEKILNPCSNGMVDEKNGINKTVFSYLESHDHHSISVKIEADLLQKDQYGFPKGKRSKIRQADCYAIALYTACGCPMIRNGQEFADNWYIPESGKLRVVPRPLHWKYIHDKFGRQTLDLYKKLNEIAKDFPCLGSNEYQHIFTHPDKQTVCFQRADKQNTLIVCINFSNQTQSETIIFPYKKKWKELIHQQHITLLSNEQKIEIPNQSGLIFSHSQKNYFIKQT